MNWKDKLLYTKKPLNITANRPHFVGDKSHNPTNPILKRVKIPLPPTNMQSA